MAKTNEIAVPKEDLRQVLRHLGELEMLTCSGYSGELHESSCPARQIWQLVNRLQQRLNHGR